MALVRLKVLIEGTDKTLQIPYYVLNFNKSLWNGELWNCGLVLGTYCSELLITHSSDQMVRPAVKEVGISPPVLEQVALWY